MTEQESLNPVHEARKLEQKEFARKVEKRKKQPAKEKYKLVGDKVVAISETFKGKYSRYVGKFKDFKHLVK